MTALIIICTALIAILISLVGYQVAHLHDSLVSDGRLNRKCKIDTEWGGLFIGRKSCSTHETHWDPPGECPGLALDRAVVLDIGVPIAFRIMGEEKVRELVPTDITATAGYSRTVNLIDRQTYEHQNRLPGAYIDGSA